MTDEPLRGTSLKKKSLVYRFFNLYLWLTLINLLIFWLAVGSNQIRLIQKSAISELKATAADIIIRVTPALKNKRRKNLFRKISSALLQYRQNEKFVHKGFALLDENGKLLYQTGSLPLIPNYKSDQTLRRKVIRATWLSEFKHNRYYATPNIESISLVNLFAMDANDSIELFIPFISKGVNPLIFYTKLRMNSIRNEFRNMILLALGMLILIVIAQIIGGYFIYRVIVKPVLALAAIARSVGKGNYELPDLEVKSDDELGLLWVTFRDMVGLIKEKTKKLNQIIEQLQERDKMMQNELTMAAEVQEGILPKKIGTKLFRAAVYFNPLEKVSGDYYDIFRVSDESEIVLLADVSGHGIPAALITMLTKTEFESLILRNLSPKEIFAKVNDRFNEVIITDDYVTASLCKVTANNTLLYSNAGMPPPRIYRKKTRRLERLMLKGSLLGVFPSRDEMFSTIEVPFEKEDRLYLFSDGILDAGNTNISKEDFDRIIMDSAELEFEQVVPSIISTLNRRSQGAKVTDDRTLLVLEFL